MPQTSNYGFTLWGVSPPEGATGKTLRDAIIGEGNDSLANKVDAALKAVEDSIPTKVSDLENDATYLTEEDLPDPPHVPEKVSELTNDSGFITAGDVPKKVSELQNDSGFLTESDLPAPPAVPTKTSDLENDSGYITAADIPEVTVPTKVSELSNDTGYLTEDDLPDVPSKTSQLQNDSGFITAADVPEVTVPTKVSELDNDSGYLTEDDLPAPPTVPTKTSELTNDSGYITAADIPEVQDVPTKTSELENDSGFITMDDLPEDNGGHIPILFGEKIAWDGDTVGLMRVSGSALGSDASNMYTYFSYYKVSDKTDLCRYQIQIADKEPATWNASGIYDPVKITENAYYYVDVGSNYHNSVLFVILEDDTAVFNSAFPQKGTYAAKMTGNLFGAINSYVVSATPMPTPYHADTAPEGTIAEVTGNKVAEITNGATDAQYPSAKAVRAYVTGAIPDTSGFLTASDLPPIPAKTSDLTNDSGFITASAVPTKISQLVNDGQYVTERTFTDRSQFIVDGLGSCRYVFGANVEWQTAPSLTPLFDGLYLLHRLNEEEKAFIQTTRGPIRATLGMRELGTSNWEYTIEMLQPDKMEDHSYYDVSVLGYWWGENVLVCIVTDDLDYSGYHYPAGVYAFRYCEDNTEVTITSVEILRPLRYGEFLQASDLTSICNELASLRSQIGEIASLRTEIAELRGTSQTLTARLADAEREIADLKARVCALESGTAGGDAANVKGEVLEVSGSVDEAMETLILNGTVDGETLILGGRTGSSASVSGEALAVSGTVDGETLDVAGAVVDGLLVVGTELGTASVQNDTVEIGEVAMVQKDMLSAAGTVEHEMWEVD